MAIFWLVICLLGPLVSVSGKPPKPIRSGTDADDGEFPHQVALTYKNNLICGGSIIDSRHILTAAHCIDKKSTAMLNAIDVVSGTNNIFSKNKTINHIRNHTMHPLYSGSPSWSNDIAILTLKNEIKFNEKTKPLKLPTTEDPGDVVAVACGWGDVQYPHSPTPLKLQKLHMRIIPKGTCVLPKNRQVLDSQICALDRIGHGLCSGDSGGPLVHAGTIVGISSYVYPCGLGHPDIFTRVYAYVDWIKDEIKKSSV